MTQYCVSYQFKSGRVQTKSFDSATARALWILGIEATGITLLREWLEEGETIG